MKNCRRQHGPKPRRVEIGQNGSCGERSRVFWSCLDGDNRRPKGGGALFCGPPDRPSMRRPQKARASSPARIRQTTLRHGPRRNRQHLATRRGAASRDLLVDHMLQGKQMLGLGERLVTGAAIVKVFFHQARALWAENREIPITVAKFRAEFLTPAPALLHHRDGRA